MKKLFLLLSLLVLTGCNIGVERSVEEGIPLQSDDETSTNGNELFARVISLEKDSVTLTTSEATEGPTETYAFASEALVNAFKDDKLISLTPEEAVIPIMSSSNSNDYYFYFVLNNDTVLKMTQAHMPAEGYDSNSDDLVYVTNVYEKDGKDFITVDPMQFLSCEEAGKGDTCPDGYAIQNDTVDAVDYEVPFDQTVIFTIRWGTSIVSAYPMNFSDFQQKFTDEKENFSFIPYHLKTDGEQVVSLTEKYIP